MHIGLYVGLEGLSLRLNRWEPRLTLEWWWGVYPKRRRERLIGISVALLDHALKSRRWVFWSRELWVSPVRRALISTGRTKAA